MDINLLFICDRRSVDPDFTRKLEVVLKQDGFPAFGNIDIRSVSTIAEGESHLFECAPVLLVIEATVDNCTNFIHSLKADEMFSLLPILVLVPSDACSSTDEYFLAGADAVVLSPEDDEILLRHISPLLRTRLLTDGILRRVMKLEEDNIRNFIMLDLIKRYIPKTVWDIASRFAEEQTIRIPEKEEEVTIVHGDIFGFTTISQYLLPKEVIGMLNEAYEVVARIIYGHDGDIDKFIGDAFLAVFQDPGSAIRSALELQFALHDLQEDRSARGLVPFSFRIGVHTGPVIRGNVGSELRSDNTLIGDTVNTTARIGSVAPTGEVFVSDQSCLKAGITVPESYRVEEKLKGKDIPVVLYNLYRYACDSGNNVKSLFGS